MKKVKKNLYLASSSDKDVESYVKKDIKYPESESGITLDLVKRVLQRESSVNRLVSIDIDRDFGSWSLLGDIVKVKLNYSESGCEPETVIVKFQKTSYPEREGQIYQLLSEVKIPCIPRLFGIFDNGALVLEDMSPTEPVSVKNLTIPQVKEVISILAEVNGRFVGDSRVPKNPVIQYTNVIKHNMKESWPVFETRYHDQLGDVTTDFDWIWKNAEVVSAQHNSEPTTLSHTDVHIENLLFTDENKPILIDWQLAGQKVLPFDVSRLLACSLKVEERQKYEDRLLNEYYELLPDPVKAGYSFERFFLDYRACITRSMLSAVMAVGPRFESRPDKLEYADIMAKQVIAAVKDLKPVDAIQELIRRNISKP
ncbi:MAG: DUF1679 domain-containing protein [Dehalococcoidales bacterium]|nr:MAG: DUF1679 domain-containing protein [Dehalococcoidales bacterium]